MNTYSKQLKASLVLGVRNISFSVAPKYVKISDFLFFDFLDLDKSTTVSSVLPLPLTNSLFSTLSVFEAANPDNSVVFNIEVSGTAILLKL